MNKEHHSRYLSDAPIDAPIDAPPPVHSNELRQPAKPEPAPEPDIEDSGVFAWSRPSLWPRPWQLAAIIAGLALFGAFGVHLAMQDMSGQPCPTYMAAYERLPAFQPPSEGQRRRYEACKRGESYDPRRGE